MSVCVERDWVALKEAETIHSTGKMEKKIRISATTQRQAMLKRFWNFWDDRRFW
jgi:hypothetical protein